MVCGEVGDGDASEEYFIHQGLIRARSGFFDKALKERKVMLKEEEPDIFAVYLERLYADQLPTEQSECEEERHDTDEYTVLSKLYVLAEMLLDETTKEIVLQAITAKSNEVLHDGRRYFPGLSCVRIVYHGTPDISPARCLIVQLYTDNDLDISNATPESIPKDFAIDLAVSLMNKRPIRRVHEQCMSQLAARTNEVTRQEEALNNKTELLRMNSASIKRLESEKSLLEIQKKALELKVSELEIGNPKRSLRLM